MSILNARFSVSAAGLIVPSVAVAAPPATAAASAPAAAAASAPAAAAAAGASAGKAGKASKVAAASASAPPPPAAGGGAAAAAVTDKAASAAEARARAAEAKAARADKWGGGASAAAGGADAAKKKKAAIERLEYVNTTPPGEKKDMSGEMLPAYHPAAVEAAWDAWWSARGFYAGDAAAGEAAGEAGRFAMVIPPPNVTGSLHLGHALTSAVEDCMTRFARMQGKPTLWLPGTDHAGIATQAVVEKRLARERGLTRHDLGRAAFTEEVWKWKEAYGSRITAQQRHLAISADWGRERFTMDAQLSAAVVEAFVRLSERGLVYRDTKLVNWCCHLRTAISDIEVDYLDIEKRTRLPVPGHDPKKTYEFGVLTSFAYAIEGGGEIVVATTRPETMLGDVAVAVHPGDARYAHLHGARLRHPFFPERELRIITDAELVDPAFGTGAVKITPAHDANDYRCGKKHGLPFITIFGEDGRVNERGGPAFAGLMRFDAREAVLAALGERGLLRGKADNKMRLGLCSRSGDVIEPLIKPQWYVRCAEMARAAADAVRSGELRLVPAGGHEATWFSWLDNIQDWCVSRQLWWGHRVPAYFVALRGAPAAEPSDARHWVVARSEAAARAQAAARFAVPEADVTLTQDEDVLDTWFSSGLFPFATLGWPNEEHPDFKGFYPNTILETGHDILFFWVARMVMLGLTLTGKLPFRTVYLHAMVRDKYGRKMSKSLGNVIDPMEIINGCTLDALRTKIREGNLPAKEVEVAIKGQEADFPDGIPECGADALRFGLLAYTVQGRDLNLDIARVVAYRAFCNKLWNATRFALAHLAADRFAPPPLLDLADELAAAGAAGRLAPRDAWVLSRLAGAAEAAGAALREHSYGAAAQALYAFWLHDLCDYYLELLKPLLHGGAGAPPGVPLAEAQRLARGALYLCLDAGLKLLHPMMPFITEELWNRLPGRGAAWRADARAPGARADPPSLVVAPWPALPPALRRPDVEAAFATFQAVVRAGRSLRSDADIPPSRDAAFCVVVEPAAAAAALQPFADDLRGLLRSSALRLAAPAEAGPADGCSIATVAEGLTVRLQLKGLVDPAAEAEKLAKRIANLERGLERLAGKMATPMYAEKVPAEVRAADAEAAASQRSQLEVLHALKAKYEGWAAPAAQ